MTDIKAQVQYYQIQDEVGQRLDNYLITRLKTVPKSHIYRLLRKGEVRVNKKRAKPDYRLQTDDIVRIPPVILKSQPPKPQAPKSIQRCLEDSILYEDKYLIVLNKPHGVAVHGGSGLNFGVIEALRQARPKEKFLELAHRLDRDTSGCLVVAKKPSILKEVHRLLREGEVEKTYLTLLKGQLPSQGVRVDKPLEKFHCVGGERVVKVSAQGKPALTIFTPLKQLPLANLVSVALMTGRTHQIRVHAQSIGHPVAADDKYGDKDFNKTMKQHQLKRLFLHAHNIKFALPSVELTINITAELPDDLQLCLDSLFK